MKLSEAIRALREQLEPAYGREEAASITDLAMEHLTGISKTERIFKNEYALSSTQTDQFQKLKERLKNHEPIQYIMNKAWFYGMELYVDENVLIPRPETEELVKWVLDDVRASGRDVFVKGKMHADRTRQLKVLDVGTGSGCIALALKRAMPLAEVWACDVSEGALNVARRNGSALNIRVDFQGLNFLDKEQQTQLPTVDVIVSNPPYVPLKDKDQLHANVVDHEPHAALFVPDHDPLVFYKAIASFGKKRLYGTGHIYVETHEESAEEVLALFRASGFRNLELKKDLQGKNRMVRAEK